MNTSVPSREKWSDTEDFDSDTEDSDAEWKDHIRGSEVVDSAATAVNRLNNFGKNFVLSDDVSVLLQNSTGNRPYIDDGDLKLVPMVIVQQIYVRPSMQRKGLATKTVLELTRAAAKMTPPRMLLIESVMSDELKKLLKKLDEGDDVDVFKGTESSAIGNFVLSVKEKH